MNTMFDIGDGVLHEINLNNIIKTLESMQKLIDLDEEIYRKHWVTVNFVEHKNLQKIAESSDKLESLLCQLNLATQRYGERSAQIIGLQYRSQLLDKKVTAALFGMQKSMLYRFFNHVNKKTFIYILRSIETIESDKKIITFLQEVNKIGDEIIRATYEAINAQIEYNKTLLTQGKAHSLKKRIALRLQKKLLELPSWIFSGVKASRKGWNTNRLPQDMPHTFIVGDYIHLIREYIAQEMFLNGYSIEQAISTAGCRSQYDVFTGSKGARKEQMMKKLHDKGWSLDQIGDMFGAAPITVKKACSLTKSTKMGPA